MRGSLFFAVLTGLLTTTAVLAGDPQGVAGPSWKSTATHHAAAEKTARLDHLRRAIEHLQAAGLRDLAIQIEEHAEREVLRSELSLKRTELANISKDIQRLERLLNSQAETPAQDDRKQVTTRIKVVEVDVSKLESLGFKLGGDGLSGILFEESPDVGQTDDKSVARQKLVDASVAKLLEWLCDCQVAKVVAEPVLMTTSGKPASFFSGGEVPVVTTDGEQYAINYRQIGTRIELLAVVLPNGKIRMEVRPTLSRVVQAAATEESKSGSSKYESQSFEATAELETGQTLALGGIATTTDSVHGEPAGPARKKLFKRQPPGRRELIVLISPEIVDVKTNSADVSSKPLDMNSAPRALQLYPNALKATKPQDN